MTSTHSAPISIEDAARGLAPWKPIELAVANETVLRLARLDGAFAWHAHEDDELFLCWSGSFRIEVESADPIVLERGDLFVVRRGVRHRPVADSGPAYAILVERPETTQYGDAEAKR